MEELKLILQTVEVLGEAGKEAFIWWLVVDKGLAFLAVMAFIAVLAYAIRLVAIQAVSLTRLEQLRDQMGVGMTGPLMEREYLEMVEWVNKRKG